MSKQTISKADAKKALQSVILKHNKKVGQVFVDNKSKMDYTVVSTGSAVIDDATGVGGLAIGRVYEIYGLESSGKSSICYSICKKFQEAYPEKYVIYIDPEQAVNTKYMESFGVDVSEDALKISNPEVAEDGMQLINDLAETGACSLIIYDSIPSAPTKAQVEKQFDENTMGELARLLSKAVPDIKNAAARTETTIVFINQVRDKLSYGGGTTTPGGKAVPFYASMRLWIKKRDLITDSSKATIGQEIEVEFKKNKIGTPYQVCKTKLFFGKGFDFEFEYSDIAIKYGLIVRGGAWYKWHDSTGVEVKKNGQIRVAEYFKDNPIEFEWLKEEIKKIQKENNSPIEVDDTLEDEATVIEEE